MQAGKIFAHATLRIVRSAQVKFNRRLLSLCLCAILSSWTSQAAEPGSPNEFQARRGLNFSSWLANAPRQPLYERDFRQVKQAGFDHIRLPFNPEQFGYRLEQERKNPADAVDFSALDRAIDLAATHELAVILDVHPRSAFMKTLEDSAWAETQFIELWSALAQRYKKVPAQKIAFALLNEPQYYTAGERYHQFMRRLIAAIRAVAPAHTIIVSAPRGSSIKGVTAMQPFDDPNIIYDFHFYEPYIVTHQGIHMGFPEKMLRFFRKVPYPSDRVERDANYHAPMATIPEQAQSELKEYTDAGWNDEKIAGRIKVAADWAAQHQARLICGEFGALRNHIDPASRYRWIAGVRRALESHGIGWSLWDYADLAGIAKPVGKTSTDPVDGSIRLVNPAQGHRMIEPEALAALGLHTP